MHTKGFTLVEVLIGLFIAVIASLYAAKTIGSTNRVVDAGRDTFIATNLAHEGLDLTRAMRDNTWLMNPDTAPPIDRSNWMSQSGICADEPDGGSHTYVIDFQKVRDFVRDEGVGIVEHADGLGKLLYIRGGNNLWTHQTTPRSSGYSRILSADCSQAAEFVTITSTVSWADARGTTKQVAIKEQLYNWMP